MKENVFKPDHTYRVNHDIESGELIATDITGSIAFYNDSEKKIFKYLDKLETEVAFYPDVDRRDGMLKIISKMREDIKKEFSSRIETVGETKGVGDPITYPKDFTNKD